MSGTFEMYGGTIAGNIADDGGGVYLYSYGNFKMHGGTIADHNVIQGGGVFVFGGTFEMSGGTIVNNKAELLGGGVYFDVGTFEMSGGTVANNSAGIGGGVWISHYHGTFAIFKIPADAVGVVFSNNSADDAYDRDPKDDDLYAMFILGDVTWSDPFTQGYNNFDVSYEVGTPLTFNTLFFEINADDDDVEGLISADKPILFDKPFGILPALKRDGYVLTGWFTEVEGGEKITPSTIVPAAEDYVLYAQWTEYVDTGGDDKDLADGKDSGSGFGQAFITENSKNDNKNDNKNELNNSGSGKTPAPPAKGTNGGDSKDAQDTSTGGMRGALFWVMVLLTAPAIVAGFIYYKNKGKV